jgi:hypothetical protein
MKKILGTGLVILSLFFAGCSSDSSDDTTNDSIEANNQTSSITATINGAAWTGKINSVTLIRVTSSKEQRFDISAQDGSQLLSLAFYSELTTDNGMPVRTYSFDEENEISDALFINTYLIGNSTFTEHAPKIGKLTVTSINKEKKTISGTFSFTAVKGGSLQNQIVTPETVEVSKGVFTNLSYKVITAD